MYVSIKQVAKSQVSHETFYNVFAKSSEVEHISVDIESTLGNYIPLEEYVKLAVSLMPLDHLVLVAARLVMARLEIINPKLFPRKNASDEVMESKSQRFIELTEHFSASVVDIEVFKDSVTAKNTMRLGSRLDEKLDKLLSLPSSVKPKDHPIEFAKVMAVRELNDLIELYRKTLIDQDIESYKVVEHLSAALANNSICCDDANKGINRYQGFAEYCVKAPVSRDSYLGHCVVVLFA
ncbi:hypothetical protein SIPHO059v1_p0089 [Vibrio phage 264E42.1]|nr:hypothetical protein SIPHO059v1_p0089 [Vibrio phage 264E42.1]